MAALEDRVLQISESIGPDTFLLQKTAIGFRKFYDVIGLNNQCYYTIVNKTVPSEWEIGLGRVGGTSANTTLTRDTIISSSTGYKVNFSYGVKDVFVTVPSSKPTSLDANNNILLDTQNLSLQNSSLPNIRPSVYFNFARSKQLDPRIHFERHDSLNNPQILGAAYYYDSNTVAKAEENLLLYSGSLFNFPWANAATTAVNTINNAVAPDETTTASTIVYLTGGNLEVWRYNDTLSSGIQYTISVYVKSVSGNTNFTADLANVEVSPIFVLTTNWQRFSWTVTPAADRVWFDFQLGAAGTINVWGAQLEKRSSNTAYTATTTSAITNYIPQYIRVPQNIPRFDHNPITRESLGLLIDGGFYNNIIYSEYFANTAWIKANTTITANTIVSPDGFISGTKLVLNSANTYSSNNGLYQIVPQGDDYDATYTWSIFAKAGELPSIKFINGWNGNTAIFNLSSGNIEKYSNSCSMYPVGNGWHRCIYTYAPTLGTITTNKITFQPYSSSLSTGDGYSGIFIWGAQLENSNNPSSYTRTLDLRIEREYEDCQFTYKNFYPLYNTYEGTFVISVDYAPFGTDETNYGYGGLFTLGDFSVYTSSNNNFKISAATSNTAYLAKNTTHTVAISYSYQGRAVANGNVLIAVDGIFYSDISTGLSMFPVLSNNWQNGLNIGSNMINGSYLNGHIRELFYYPVAYSANTLVALTK